MNKVRKLWLKVGLITAALASVIVATTVYIAQPTYAQVSDVIKKKAVAYGISQCYKQGYMNSPVTASSYNAGWGPSSLVNYGGSYAQPTGAYGDGYSLTLSCSELLNGNGLNGTFQGAFSWVNAPENANNTTAFSSFMTGIGYTKSNASAGQCASFTYRSGNSVDTLKLCAETDNGQANGKITGKITVSGDGGINVTFKTTDTTVEPVCSQFGSWASSCSVHSYTQGTTQFDTLMGEIMGDLIENRKNGIMFGDWKLDENVAFEPMGETLATYTITNKTTAANKATSYLTGYSGSNIALTPNEQLALLQDYMLNFYAIERYGGACDLDDSQANVAKNAGYSLIETSMFGSGLQKCWVRPTKNKNSSVTGFDKDGYFTGTPLYYDDVVGAFGGSVEDLFKGDKEKCNTAATNALSAANSIVDMYYLGSTTKEEHDRALKTIDELNAIKKQHGQYWHEENGTIVCYPFTNVDGTITDTPTDSTTPPDTPTTNPEDTSDAASCFTNGDSLGWILCPTIKMIGSATTAAYENIEQNWLQMDTSFFDTNKGAYDGWTQFRNYANILFAIGFIIIILAQVTGIGISNYNIKKLLPKLIMVVILVNLSFIICQIAVDISNILGSTLYDTFKGLNTGKSEAFGVGNLVVGLLSSVGTGALIGVGVAGIAVAALTSPGAVLIPLLISLIGALIGLLFFFIILAVRKAGIVILVVLAPVAIVCYALPNTKSFFDRWKKLFMSLLMVYPICAVLMGGGYFASNLLLKSGDNGFVETLVALLLQVVPIFLVPGVLRSSLALAGNIGTKLSMMGSNLGRRTTGAIANAEMTKRAKTSMNYWGANTGQKALGKVGGAIGKIPGVGRAARAIGNTGVGKALKAGQTRRIARNKIDYRTMRLQEDADAFVAEHTNQGSIDNALAAQKFKQQQSLIDEATDSIIKGGVKYKDSAGREQTINENDFGEATYDPATHELVEGSLDHALDSYLSQYDASGGTDEAALVQAKAIARVMIDRGGDAGRTSVMKRLKKRNFDATTGNPIRTDSFNELTKYIARDGKWMASLKKEDFGSFRMVSDGSRGAPEAGHADVMRGLHDYNTAGANKVTTSSAANLGQSFFDGYNDEITRGTYTVGGSNYNQAATDDLLRLAETFERAMADPVTAKDIKASDLDEMNKIVKAAYDARQARWVNAARTAPANAGKTTAQLEAEYAKQFGAYQDLVPGQQLKISHAKMPTGWKRADRADVIRFTSLGLREGDWIDGSGAGVRLNTEQIRRAEAIEQQHIDADIKNSMR